MKQIAATYDVVDGPNDQGEMCPGSTDGRLQDAPLLRRGSRLPGAAQLLPPRFTRPAILGDQFPNPYPLGLRHFG